MLKRGAALITGEKDSVGGFFTHDDDDQLDKYDEDPTTTAAHSYPGGSHQACAGLMRTRMELYWEGEKTMEQRRHAGCP